MARSSPLATAFFGPYDALVPPWKYDAAVPSGFSFDEAVKTRTAAWAALKAALTGSDLELATAFEKAQSDIDPILKRMIEARSTKNQAEWDKAAGELETALKAPAYAGVEAKLFAAIEKITDPATLAKLRPVFAAAYEAAHKSTTGPETTIGTGPAKYSFSGAVLGPDLKPVPATLLIKHEDGSVIRVTRGADGKEKIELKGPGAGDDKFLPYTASTEDTALITAAREAAQRKIQEETPGVPAKPTQAEIDEKMQAAMQAVAKGASTSATLAGTKWTATTTPNENGTGPGATVFTNPEYPDLKVVVAPDGSRQFLDKSGNPVDTTTADGPGAKLKAAFEGLKEKPEAARKLLGEILSATQLTASDYGVGVDKMSDAAKEALRVKLRAAAEQIKAAGGAIDPKTLQFTMVTGGMADMEGNATDERNKQHAEARRADMEAFMRSEGAALLGIPPENIHFATATGTVQTRTDRRASFAMLTVGEIPKAAAPAPAAAKTGPVAPITLEFSKAGDALTLPDATRTEIGKMVAAVTSSPLPAGQKRRYVFEVAGVDAAHMPAATEAVKTAATAAGIKSDEIVVKPAEVKPGESPAAKPTVKVTPTVAPP